MAWRVSFADATPVLDLSSEWDGSRFEAGGVSVELLTENRSRPAIEVRKGRRGPQVRLRAYRVSTTKSMNPFDGSVAVSFTRV